MADVIVPHLAWPMRLSAGSFAALEQDSAEELEQSAALIASYEPGTRDDDPEFGVRTQLFREIRQVTAEAVASDLRRVDPRLDVRGIASDGDPGERIIDIAVRKVERG